MPSKPFDALIGTSATEATHPQVDGVVPGSVTFEWLEGRHFLVQRSHNGHAFPLRDRQGGDQPG